LLISCKILFVASLQSHIATCVAISNSDASVNVFSLNSFGSLLSQVAMISSSNKLFAGIFVLSAIVTIQSSHILSMAFQFFIVAIMLS
jgi:hypothetical protein